MRDALLSMDKETIEDKAWEEGIDLPEEIEDETFWLAIHLARTKYEGLPMFERAASSAWLKAQDYPTLDSGTIIDPEEFDEEEYENYLERCKEFGVDVS